MAICPNCGEENPDKFRLCAFCGTPLAPTLPAQDVRKTVTIVFSDLKGSTAMAEKLDSEAVREVMSRYFDGVTIGNRTGLNTGEVVAGDPTTGQRLVTGDTVKTAARLEQAAPPSDVLIGETTYRLVRDALDVEPVEPLDPTGKARPARKTRSS